MIRSQPLFVIGAPRSGTTFLAAVLNRHPMITLTNESRLGVLFKHLIEIDCARPDLLDQQHCARFQSFIERRGGALIEEYYRSELGVTTPVWGDKHPPYADPTVLSGRQGSRPRLPVSGSCLGLLRAMLPHAKFIHIRREPAAVARSLVGKGWIGSVSEGVAVWRQYVREIENFFAELDPDKGLVIAYSDLIEEPEETATRIVNFLEIPDPAPIARFLRAERRAPTPFSGPVSDLREAYRAWRPEVVSPEKASAEE